PAAPRRRATGAHPRPTHPSHTIPVRLRGRSVVSVALRRGPYGDGGAGAMRVAGAGSAGERVTGTRLGTGRQGVGDGGLDRGAGEAYFISLPATSRPGCLTTGVRG